MSKFPTYAFDNVREKKGKGYDGDDIAHVLDYYFPEWRRNRAHLFPLGHGKSDDGRDVLIYVPTTKKHVFRMETDEQDMSHATVTLATADDKINLTRLWRTGDVFHEKSDRRFFQLLKDFGAADS